MKLIVEQSENIEFLTESAPAGGTNLFFEGIYFQADVKNKNGRIYESRVLQPSVNTYIEEQVKQNRAVGELDHAESPTVNLDRVSHRIMSLNWNGSDVIGKSLVLKTPMGQVLQGLYDGGVRLGVSSKGLGALDPRNGAQYVKDGYMISSVDVVQDPSAPKAFVNGILEGVEFFKDETGSWKTKVEEIQLQKSRISESRMDQLRLKLLKDYLNSL